MTEFWGEVEIPPNAIVSEDGKSFWIPGELAEGDTEPLGDEWQEIGFITEGDA